MEIHELQQLLSEMSLQEKIGQMVQLTGAYFDKEAVLTGVVGEHLMIFGGFFHPKMKKAVMNFLNHYCFKQLFSGGIEPPISA